MQETRGRMRERRRADVSPYASLRWHYPDQVQRVFLTRACPVAMARRRTPALASQKIHARPGFGNRPSRPSIVPSTAQRAPETARVAPANPRLLWGFRD